MSVGLGGDGLGWALVGEALSAGLLGAGRGRGKETPQGLVNVVGVGRGAGPSENHSLI